MAESTVLTAGMDTNSDKDVSETQAKPKGKFLDYSEVDSKVAGDEPTSLTENQKLAEAGEFDQLLSSVNSNLAELGMQEESTEMIGALTEIANSGNQELRVWACGVLNWHNEMAKFLKGV